MSEKQQKWEKIETETMTFYTLRAWRAAGAEVRMTCRHGGCSLPPYDGLNLGLHVGDDAAAVVANRRLVLKEFGVAQERFVSAQQVAGKQVRRISQRDGGRGFDAYETAFPDCDGFFTAEKQMVMALFYADCLPIAVFHPQKKLLGLAHAGWRGTYENIAAALIAEMQAAYDFDPGELWCALGAGIGVCCYEVDEAFYRRFLAAYPEAAGWFIPKREGKYHFDNAKANLTLLKKAGVKRENISVLELCTACRTDLFYSHRKEAGKTGRHGLWGALI